MEMPFLRSSITRNWACIPASSGMGDNIGLLLRWSCALRTIEEHSRISTHAVDAFAALWVHRVQCIIMDDAHPYLQLVPTKAVASNTLSASSPYPKPSATLLIGGGNVNTVISVAICVDKKPQACRNIESTGMKKVTPEGQASEFEYLGLDQCRIFHQALAITGYNGTIAMIGQPVQLHDSSDANTFNGIPSCVVRLALGADTVIAGFASADAISAQTESLRVAAAVDAILGVDAAVIRAMKGLAENWSLVGKSQTNDFNASAAVISATAESKSVKSHDEAMASRMFAFDNALDYGSRKSVFSSADSSKFSATTSVDTLHFVHAAKSLASSDNLPDVAVLYNLDVLDCASDNMKHAFNGGATDRNSYLHCFAIKSCPLTYILHHCVSHIGLGLEAASLIEIKQALRCGAAPNNIVYDSPCKSMEDTRFAITAGINVNANSWGDLDKILSALNEIDVKRRTSGDNICITGDPGAGCVGLRINPLVGEGSIAELSTATATSKFGIPLTTQGRVKIVKAVVSNQCVRALMCHIGSQGMSVQILARGVAMLCILADEIDAACYAAGMLQNGDYLNGNRIHTVDIGGGLSVNYADDGIYPSFELYVSEIVRVYPRFFSQGRRVITGLCIILYDHYFFIDLN